MELKIELTNKEIARVIVMYWGQKVLRFKNKDVSDLWVIDSVTMEIEHFDSYHLELVPLSMITDEHYFAVSQLLGLHYHFEDNNIYWARQFLNSLFKPLSNFRAFDVIAVIQYLISENYAVPIFFGLDHWANGKTAIELGIAIENKPAKP